MPTKISIIQVNGNINNYFPFKVHFVWKLKTQVNNLFCAYKDILSICKLIRHSSSYYRISFEETENILFFNR